MGYKNRFRPKGERRKKGVSAPSVKKMAEATRKTKKRMPREDFSQAAVRIVREATK